MTSPTKNGPIDQIKIRYDGQTQLKGVLSGSGYPVFWIDLAPPESAAALEDRLTSADVCDRDDAQAFCDAFFSEMADFIFPPFIVSDSEIVLTEQPEWYDKHHANLVASFLEVSSPPVEPDPDSTDTDQETFESNLQHFLRTLDKANRLIDAGRATKTRKPAKPKSDSE